MSGPHPPRQLPPGSDPYGRRTPGLTPGPQPGQLPPGFDAPGQLPPDLYASRPRTAASAAAEDATRRRRTRIVQIGATALVVLVAVGVGVYLLVSTDGGGSPGTTARGPGAAAGQGAGASSAGPVPNSTATGAYRVSGPATGPTVTVTLFEDFQCPACREFEATFGAALTAIRAMPEVAVDYHPIAFLDSASSTKYSTRAANASACVAEATGAPVPGSSNESTRFAVWLRFHDALYAQQPQEGSAGLPDSTLVTMAVTAGAPESVESCIISGAHASAIAEITRAALTKDKVSGTPTVRINGKDVNPSSPGGLLAAVQKAVR